VIHPLRWFLTVVVVVMMAGCAWLARVVTAPPSDDASPVEVTVTRGTSGRELMEQLEKVTLVSHPRIAYWYLRLAGTFDVLRAGTYSVPGDSSISDLPELLGEGARVKHMVLTLIPGESIWEAAQRLEAAGLTDQLSLLDRASDRQWVRQVLDLPTGPQRPRRADGVPPTYLEGFLYPETLYFTPGTSLEEILKRVTFGFRRVWKDLSTRRRADLLAIRERYGLSKHQLVTLASLVEEEARRPEEAPIIAGVFYNRLDKDMPLQTDPTLVYHPASVGRAPTPRDRRNRDNPYNTYQYKGLPPGPICSPGRFALSAVLTPTRHDYLYFVARRDGGGGHAFAHTLEEHRDNVRTYLQTPRTHP
jgi:UPF0755 protein